MLNLTHQALEKFDNQHDFERMCADILNGLGYRDVVPIAPRGGGDGGRDITYTTPDGEKGLACVTLRADSDTKFKEDFEQRHKGEYAAYIFFTNSYLSSSQKLKYAKYCIDELGASFLAQDIEALRSLLDSALQSARRQWLHIDIDDTPKYELRVTDLRGYSATKLLADAWAAHQKKHAEFSSKSVFAGVIPSAFPTLGIYSTEETLSELKTYAEEVESFSQSLSRVLSFNIVLTSDAPDTNIEVHVRPAGKLKLSFDNELIEPPAKQNHSYDFLYRPVMPIMPNISPRDDNEFDARHKGDGVKSNLKSINTAQPKKIMDTTTFIVGDAPFELKDTVKLEVTIYSSKLSLPQLETLELVVGGAEWRDF